MTTATHGTQRDLAITADRLRVQFDELLAANQKAIGHGEELRRAFDSIADFMRRHRIGRRRR